jgi:hypothetical protein
LRLLLPSPIQTNWRIHVRDPASGRTGIYFVTNAIGNTMNALGARILAEAMPMHRPASAMLRAAGDQFLLRIVPPMRR